MKKIVFLLLLLLAASPVFAVTESFGPEYDLVVQYFQSQEEPSAMDAIWDSPELLKVGVFSQGKPFDDFAQHACDVLREKGISQQSVKVQIIDLNCLIQNEEWKVVGQMECR